MNKNLPIKSSDNFCYVSDNSVYGKIEIEKQYNHVCAFAVFLFSFAADEQKLPLKNHTIANKFANDFVVNIVRD
jgi:hypothetical protein